MVLDTQEIVKEITVFNPSIVFDPVTQKFDNVTHYTFSYLKDNFESVTVN